MDSISKRPRSSESSGRVARPRRARLAHYLSDDSKRRELHREGVRFSMTCGGGDKTPSLDAEAIHRRLQSLGDAPDGALFVWKPAVDEAIKAAREASAREWQDKLRAAQSHEFNATREELEQQAAKDGAGGPSGAATALQWGRLFDRMRTAAMDELAAAGATIADLHNEINKLQLQTKYAAKRHKKQQTALATADRLTAEANARLTMLQREMETLARAHETVKSEREALVQETNTLKTQMTMVTQQRDVDEAARRETIQRLTNDVERLQRFETIVKTVRNTVVEVRKT